MVYIGLKKFFNLLKVKGCANFTIESCEEGESGSCYLQGEGEGEVAVFSAKR